MAHNTSTSVQALKQASRLVPPTGGTPSTLEDLFANRAFLPKTFAIMISVLWRRCIVGDLTFLSSVVPYTRDFLLGFFPLVVLYEALKASSPFRGRALIWYIGVIASVYLVVNANIPAPDFLERTYDASRHRLRRRGLLVDSTTREEGLGLRLGYLRLLLHPGLYEEANCRSQAVPFSDHPTPADNHCVTVESSSPALPLARPGRSPAELQSAGDLFERSVSTLSFARAVTSSSLARSDSLRS